MIGLTKEEKNTHMKAILQIDIKEKTAKVEFHQKKISKSKFKKIQAQVFNEKNEYLEKNKLFAMHGYLYKEGEVTSPEVQEVIKKELSDVGASL
jgi:hypothetical protein